MNFSHLAFFTHALGPQFNFPQGPAVELIMLRWLHFIFGIIWIGLLYFFNLVGFPTMKQLDAAVRGKVFPVLMSRAMSWFRWSALIPWCWDCATTSRFFPPTRTIPAIPR
jgi:hypothetical protein